MNPPTEGDDRIVPDLESEAVLSQDLADVNDLNDESPDEMDSNTSDADGMEPDLTADPDHENLPPPETDPAMTFEDLKLNRAVLDAIAHAGYSHPTPIQEAVIPPALAGKDGIGQAQTGTGKTAAFVPAAP